MNDATKGLIRVMSAWAAGYAVFHLTQLSAAVATPGLIPVDAQPVIAKFLEAAIAGGYYYGARLLENRHRLFGWLLGCPCCPVYLQPGQALVHLDESTVTIAELE